MFNVILVVVKKRTMTNIYLIVGFNNHNDDDDEDTDTDNDNSYDYDNIHF